LGSAVHRRRFAERRDDATANCDFEYPFR
jgi:hypothetical protein